MAEKSRLVAGERRKLSVVDLSIEGPDEAASSRPDDEPFLEDLPVRSRRSSLQWNRNHTMNMMRRIRNLSSTPPPNFESTLPPSVHGPSRPMSTEPSHRNDLNASPDLSSYHLPASRSGPRDGTSPSASWPQLSAPSQRLGSGWATRASANNSRWSLPSEPSPQPQPKSSSSNLALVELVNKRAVEVRSEAPRSRRPSQSVHQVSKESFDMLGQIFEKAGFQVPRLEEGKVRWGKSRLEQAVTNKSSDKTDAAKRVIHSKRSQQLPRRHGRERAGRSRAEEEEDIRNGLRTPISRLVSKHMDRMAERRRQEEAEGELSLSLDDALDWSGAADDPAAMSWNSFTVKDVMHRIRQGTLDHSTVRRFSQFALDSEASQSRPHSPDAPAPPPPEEPKYPVTLPNLGGTQRRRTERRRSYGTIRLDPQCALCVSEVSRLQRQGKSDLEIMSEGYRCRSCNSVLLTEGAQDLMVEKHKFEAQLRQQEAERQRLLAIIEREIGEEEEKQRVIKAQQQKDMDAKLSASERAVRDLEEKRRREQARWEADMRQKLQKWEDKLARSNDAKVKFLKEIFAKGRLAPQRLEDVPKAEGAMQENNGVTRITLKRVLASSALLAVLTDAELGELAREARLISFPKYWRLLEEGQTAGSMWVVCAGEVDLYASGGAWRSRVPRNTMIGERTMTAGEPCPWTAVCGTPVQALEVSRAAFKKITNADSEKVQAIRYLAQESIKEFL